MNQIEKGVEKLIKVNEKLKQDKTIKLVIILSAILIVIYTAIQIYFFYTFQSVPDSLNYGFYGFFGVGGGFSLLTEIAGRMSPYYGDSGNITINDVKVPTNEGGLSDEERTGAD